MRRLLLLVWEMHTVHVEMHAWAHGHGWFLGVRVWVEGLVTQERQVVAVLLTQPSP